MKSTLAVYFLVALAARSIADLCEKCTCIEEKLDCSSMDLENHFNETEWNRTAAAGTTTVALFDYNRIVHLRAFPRLPLVKLSVSHNMIVKIDPGCFKELENITELDLSHNHLTSEQLLPNVFQGHYAPDAYEPLRNLRVLRLSANALHTLDADLFEHTPHLEELSLDSNPLRIIDRPSVIALTSIGYLKFLDLSSAALRSFPDHLLHTPRFLETLNLTSNLFSEPPLSLQDSHFLKELHLDQNPFTVITTFPKLPHLEVLSISWMPELKEIGPNALSELISLREFYCSHNPKLERIDPTAFSGPSAGAQDGQTGPPLRKIALNNNRLGYLDAELVGRWDRVEAVNIQNNPWVCECRNQWLVSSLVPSLEQLNTTAHNVAGIVCHSPEPMRGMSIVDLDHRSYHMRCLDLYDHHPENDAALLVGVLLGLILAIPLTVFVFISYRKHLYTSAARYHRAFYKRGDSLHEFVTDAALVVP